MNGDGTHHTPDEDVFRDFGARRAGLIMAFTNVEKFYQQCDPEKENLFLYGLPNETWECNLPAEKVPPEHAAHGINFARDGMDVKDWLSLMAVRSDKESRTNLMKPPSDYKDEFLMKHGVKFGAVSWFIKTAVSVLQNQTIMNAVIDGDDVIYKDYVDSSVAFGTSKCLYPCHKKNSQDNNKQVDLAGRTQKVATKINILVRLLSGRTACICLWKTDHIEQLKSHIEDQEGIPKIHMMLLYGRTTLEVGCCLRDYNIENNSTVNIVFGLRGGGPTLDTFFSNKQGLLVPTDQFMGDESWLTDDAKRKIHSTYRMIVLLHKDNLCLGNFSIKDIPIYLSRAERPMVQFKEFSVEEGRKDYDSLIAYLEEVFGMDLPKELKHFKAALSKIPDDVRDKDYHRYLYCYWGLLNSTRRSDFIIDIGQICKEGKAEAIAELKGIIIAMKLKKRNWLHGGLLQEQPFKDKNYEGKLRDYLEAQPLDILKFMRDLLEHPQPESPTGGYRCDRVQVERIFYRRFWDVWDTIIRTLLGNNSDLINFIEEFVTY